MGDQNFISAVNYSVSQIILALLFTFIFALFIYFVYRKTYQGAVFSRNFGLTLIVVSLVASMIVMAISGNLALSLGMIGALSIVRFRSAIKDPRDIAFLFWAISNGIVAGVLIYKLAIVANLMIGLIIIFFSRKIIQHKTFMLVVVGGEINRKALDEFLSRECSYVKLRLEKSFKESSELHIEVKPRDAGLGCGDITSKMHKEVAGVKNVTAVSQESGIDGA